MKKNYLLVTLAIIGLLSAACDGQEIGVETTSAPTDTTQDASDTTQATSPTTPEETQVFIMGTTSALTEITPLTSTVATQTMVNLVYDTLVVLPADASEPQPDLAESWEVSDDRLTVTFNLRSGVVFHNGKAFNATVAREYMEWAQDPANGVRESTQIADITFDTPDESTLVFHLARPMPELLSVLQRLLIWDFTDPENAIGTGPFKVAEFEPRRELVLVRNDDYWGDPPPLDEYRVRVLSDAAATAIALENAEIDAWTAPPLPEAARLAETSGIELFRAGSGGIHLFAVSTVDEPLDDRRVRQALSLAMPREEFAEVNFGLTEPTNSMWPMSSPVYSTADDAFTYDLDAARELLDEAGVEGFVLLIQMSPDTSPEVVEWAPIYQESLRAIGIDAEIEVMEQAAWVENFTGQHFTGITSSFYTLGGVIDPGLLFTTFPLRPVNNASRFESEEYTDLIEAALFEFDPGGRIELYREIGRLVQEEAFIIPIGTKESFFLLRDHVSGFDITANGWTLGGRISVNK